MATKKISELEAITEADGSDALVIVDVSEGKTNKITKNNLLQGAGHTIEMSLNENYQIVLKLKNTEGTELSTASIDLPNENAITNITYNNGKLTLTKQSGSTTEVDISGLINGLVTESDFSTFTTQLNQILQELDETKADAEDVEALQTRVTELEQENEDLKNNQLTYTPTPATSHYLQDSADSRFRKFLPIGRTTQESDPTPENPVPIKNTGDNGSVNEKVQNKNFLDSNAPTTTQGGVTLYNNGDGLYSLKGTFSTNASFKLTTRQITLESGKTYTQSIKVVSGIFKGRVVPSFKNSNGEIQYNYFMDNSTKTTTDTMTLNSYDYYISNGTTVDCTFKVQLEEGSTATDYEEHKEQTLSFPLAEGQKFYEGSHPDDDEKVHHNRMQIVLDGSDDEVFDKRSDTNEIRYYLPSNMKLSGRILTNYFTQRQSSSDKNYVRAVATEPVNTIMFKSELLNTDEMTIPEWRQWLSTHNLEIEYELAEEQTEDFTEEQQTAWEQIKKARTYKNITHISSEDETPANVEIEYVRDINTIDDRITALEAKVDLLEE